MALVWLHKYPFFRLLTPLIAGIVCGDWLFFKEVSLNLNSLKAILLFLFLVSVLSFCVKKYSFRWLFGLLVCLLFFVGGVINSYGRLQQTGRLSLEEECVHRVLITGKPEAKKRSWLCTASLGGKRVLLYFPKDSVSALIGRGDELLISSHVSLPAKDAVPGFDYGRYLLRKGVCGTGYVPAGKWKKVGNSCLKPSLLQMAQHCREKLLTIYLRQTFTLEERAILSALTLGTKEELSEEVRESFAVAGAAHVLALSGLHIGFVYMILLFFCGKRKGRSRLITFLQICLVLIGLWTFAFITGLSPSVVRAVIMGSLLCVATFTGRTSLSFNLLLAAALGMLLYRPGWLFEAGFQMSFMAVVGILFVHPWLNRKLTVNNVAGKYLWDLTTVSLAAQVGTMPLVLLYFSRFPVYSLLSNLLVVPLIPFIIGLGMLLWVLVPFPLLQEAVVQCLKLLLNALHGIVLWVERLPFSSVSTTGLRLPDVIGFYLAVCLLGAYLLNRRARTLLLLLGSILFFLSYGLLLP